MGDIWNIGTLRIKVLSEETLAILQQMEKLNLLQILQIMPQVENEPIAINTETALSPVSSEVVHAARERLTKMKAQQPHVQFNWLGAIPKEEGTLLRQQLEEMRQEWEHRI